jgi:hypothetical protein
MQQLTRSIRAVVAIVVAVLSFGSRDARAESIAWSDLEARLSDCDIVHVKHERNKVHASQIELALESQQVRWKGVGIRPPSGRYYEIATGGQVRRDSMLLSASDVMSSQYILLGKAKFAGLHTGMYELEDLRHLQGGDRITFTWTQDDCPDLRGALTANLPTSMPPGGTKTIQVDAVAAWTWTPQMMLSISFEPVWGVPAHQVTQLSNYKNHIKFDITITAPATPGNYQFRAWITQAGGDSELLFEKTIPVSWTPVSPVMGGAPSPKQVKVPQLLGVNLEAAKLALANLGLVWAVHNHDSSKPDKQQIVTAQLPAAGTIVFEGGRVALDVTPPGFSTLYLANCSSTRQTFHVWTYVGDTWRDRGPMHPMWDDNGLCPALNQPYFKLPLDDGRFQLVVVVDPSRCSQGNNPADPACRTWETWVLGNSSGQPGGAITY